MTQLEQLCRPLLETVCEYYTAAKAGAMVSESELRNKILEQLEDIRHDCEEDQALKREFTRIEKALVFFVDYTIKEGHFPISDSWKEIARSYNELSGDEKFFDVLAENMDDPEADNRLRILYLLIGLGFDGVYQKDAAYLERRMRLCATRFDQPKPLDMAQLYAPDRALHLPKRRFFTAAFIFMLIFLFMMGSFVFNAVTFGNITRGYRASLEQAINAINKAFVGDAKKMQKPEGDTAK